MRSCFNLIMLLPVALLITSQVATAEDTKETGPIEVSIRYISSRGLDHWQTNMLDGDTATSWTSSWSAAGTRAKPDHSVEFNFIRPVKIKKITLIPEKRVGAGWIKECDLKLEGGLGTTKVAQKGKEGVNLEKYKSGIENFCNNFEKRQKDANFA